PGWVQLGTDAGRTSCKGQGREDRMNLQQVPKDKRYRKCFPAPPGRALVRADYSQLHLRIAAAVTGDRGLRAAYATAADLHREMARRVTGKGEVTKAERDLAKIVNFGFLFGAGAPSFCKSTRAKYGLDFTEADAHRYREAWRAAYPQVFA